MPHWSWVFMEFWMRVSGGVGSTLCGSCLVIRLCCLVAVLEKVSVFIVVPPLHYVMVMLIYRGIT
jgi:hypothetical protein